MIIAAVPERIPGGYRLEIEEVDSFDEKGESKEKDSEEKTNYLEEL